MDGVLIIDKPKGLTSHDVVQQVRKVLNQPKVGHFGTLDPLATGVLPIALGKATRLQQFYLSSRKVYLGSIRFGFSTTTYDAEGTPTLEPQEPHLSCERLETAGRSFLGEIYQVPPAFSAKKIKGVPAHRLARKNKPFSLNPQKVHIYRLDFDLQSKEIADFEVECSSGTYIRSLAHDLGQALGCGAHLIALRRAASGEFSLDRSFEFSNLKTDLTMEKVREHLIRLEELVPWIPSLRMSLEDALRVRHGMSVRIDPVEATRLIHAAQETKLVRRIRLFSREGELLGLGELTPSLDCQGDFEIKPKVILSNL